MGALAPCWGILMAGRTDYIKQLGCLTVNLRHQHPSGHPTLRAQGIGKMKNLYFLAPAQTKRMQPPIPVSCEALFRSNLQKNTGPVSCFFLQIAPTRCFINFNFPMGRPFKKNQEIKQLENLQKLCLSTRDISLLVDGHPFKPTISNSQGT